MVNYYDILGVPETATMEAIKAAFKRLAVQYHPDKNPDNPLMEERFKEINQAYQVLSNPYQKARYDLMRQYGSIQPEVTYTYQPAPPPSYRRRYAEPKVDYEENWKATLYAFAFTFAVALVVMSAIGLKKWYDSVREEERLANRRSTYEQAMTLYAAGNLDSTFVLIKALNGFDTEKEKDMALFSQGLVDETKYLGETNYVVGNYEEAIYYLEMLDKHTNIRELSLKEALAISYKETAQPEESIHLFTQLMLKGYRNIFTFVQMAEIYRDDLHDYEQARHYFELANNSAKQYYESAYGKGYVVILNGYILPELHYKLYTGLADIYLRLGEPARAIDITRWNKQVWSNRKDNYLIAAEGYRQLGNDMKANEELMMMRLKVY